MRFLGCLLSVLPRWLLRAQWAALAGALAAARSSAASLQDYSPLFVAALIAAEDRRFLHHRGVDVLGIARALWRNTLHGACEGASTIEQQLVRTLTQRYERTLRRKAREALLATLVETVVPKREIPMLYLSVAYFGWRASGLDQACRRFAVPVEGPTLWDACGIVARITYPEPQVASPGLRFRIRRRQQRLARVLSERGSAPLVAPLPSETR